MTPTAATVEEPAVSASALERPRGRSGVQPGDVVIRVGDRAVVVADSLVVAVRDHAPGGTVEITCARDGRSGTTGATLDGTD